jgi:hypothetical protein
MATRIDHRAEFAAGLDAAYTAVAGEDALRARLARLGGHDADVVSYAESGGQLRIELRQGVSADKLPGPVRALHKGDLMVRRFQTWRRSGDGYTGDVSVEVGGVPGEITARTFLTGDDKRSTLRTDGEVSVRIPLVGGRVESFVAEQVTRLLQSEAEFMAKWLTEAG